MNGTRACVLAGMAVVVLAGTAGVCLAFPPQHAVSGFGNLPTESRTRWCGINDIGAIVGHCIATGGCDKGILHTNYASVATSLADLSTQDAFGIAVLLLLVLMFVPPFNSVLGKLVNRVGKWFIGVVHIMARISRVLRIVSSPSLLAQWRKLRKDRHFDWSSLKEIPVCSICGTTTVILPSGTHVAGSLLSKIILEPRERRAVSGSPGMG